VTKAAGGPAAGGAGAAELAARLESMASSDVAAQLSRYFKTGEGQYGAGDTFIGVRMGQIFEAAKEFHDLPTEEIEKLLDSPIHEVRAGGVAIMDRQARSKRTPQDRRKDLYELFLRRSDRINNWDLVDLGAPYVVGGYLVDKPRDILYELARSDNLWERRIAIIATLYFLRHGDVGDALAIAEMLLDDRHDLIHKAAGWVLREVGRRDFAGQLAFLDRHGATMPRTMLRYAIEAHRS
jgi:3-methyladenine DNA glycosylase AlkD